MLPTADFASLYVDVMGALALGVWLVFDDLAVLYMGLNIYNFNKKN